MRNLIYSEAVKTATDSIYDRMSHLIPQVEWRVYAPLIARINVLKRERNAVILAHNYMTPQIFHGVADIVGDSLGLAREAAKTDARVIVMAGVHFMAETAKIVNPGKTVLIPDPEAGCSLASSITPEDVRRVKKRYPGLPVVTYINTTAGVKAECDVTCTSGNAVRIVEALDSDEVVFLPDRYLAAYVAGQTGKTIIPWSGSCEVHEKFTPEEIHELRSGHSNLTVMAHPECPEEVIEAADFAGSTSEMIRFIETRGTGAVLLVTECSMSDNVSVRFPEIEFVRPCNLCPHMKKITLEGILDSLETMTPEVHIEPRTGEGARAAVARMFELAGPS